MSVTDWVEWHADYADPASALSDRRRAVQAEIARVLPGVSTVVSFCAGEGEDLLGLLAVGSGLRGVLVELDPRNVAVLRTRAAEVGPALTVVEGDAADPRLYAGSVPADLVLLCGVLGNISDDDVLTTVAAMPAFTAAGGTCVWTRTRREPDLTRAVRAAFVAAGFAETAFVTSDDALWSVGAARYGGPPMALPTEKLFTFVV